MVKQPELPAIGVMTGGTLISQPPFVIAVLVAADTLSGRVFERLRCMTFLTRHSAMQANKRKAGQVVIKGNVLAPASGVMAAGTIAAKFLLVHIILTMTGDAGSWLFHFQALPSPGFHGRN